MTIYIYNQENFRLEQQKMVEFRYVLIDNFDRFKFKTKLISQYICIINSMKYRRKGKMYQKKIIRNTIYYI